MKRMTEIGIVLVGALALTTGIASAQRQTEFRTVRGTVVDRSEAAAGSAVVYLRNSRTLTVKTYIAEQNGQYHFTGLDPNSDYQIHAERGNQMSGNQTISSLDSRKEFVVSLKLDKEKK
jgi:hypothetical protein